MFVNVTAVLPTTSSPVVVFVFVESGFEPTITVAPLAGWKTTRAPLGPLDASAESAWSA